MIVFGPAVIGGLNILGFIKELFFYTQIL